MLAQWCFAILIAADFTAKLGTFDNGESPRAVTENVFSPIDTGGPIIVPHPDAQMTMKRAMVWSRFIPSPLYGMANFVPGDLSWC